MLFSAILLVKVWSQHHKNPCFVYMYMKVTSNFDHCTASQQTQPLNKTMKFRGSTFLLHVVNMSVTKMVYSRRCMQELMQCREVLISSCPNITRVHKLLVGVTTTSYWHRTIARNPHSTTQDSNLLTLSPRTAPSSSGWRYRPPTYNMQLAALSHTQQLPDASARLQGRLRPLLW